jgi:hypothetical protein
MYLYVMYPTEEELGMLMSLFSVNVHLCGWMGEKWDILSQARGWTGLGGAKK